MAVIGQFFGPLAAGRGGPAREPGRWQTETMRIQLDPAVQPRGLEAVLGSRGAPMRNILVVSGFCAAAALAASAIMEARAQQAPAAPAAPAATPQPLPPGSPLLAR